MRLKTTKSKYSGFVFDNTPQYNPINKKDRNINEKGVDTIFYNNSVSFSINMHVST